MNDFTKEELEMIRDDIKHDLSISALTNHDFYLKFLIKVERMIDNYCEHDEGIGIDYPAAQCMKCGACLGW